MHGIIVLNRNGRRPLTRRRRKKASPFKSSFKTIVLWLLFFLFVSSSAILFFVLLYLDLVLREKNSKELALCCGAFSVCLLTSLRIWLSLPDDLSEERDPVVRIRRSWFKFVRREEPISDESLPEGHTQFDQTLVETMRRNGFVLDGTIVRQQTNQPAHDFITINSEHLARGPVVRVRRSWFNVFRPEDPDRVETVTDPTVAARLRQNGYIVEGARPNQAGPRGHEYITVNNEFLTSDFSLEKFIRESTALPPAYSTLDLSLDSEPPPQYEEALQQMENNTHGVEHNSAQDGGRLLSDRGAVEIDLEAAVDSNHDPIVPLGAESSLRPMLSLREEQIGGTSCG